MNLDVSIETIRNYASLAEWTSKDVLVGSVGSVNQFKDNLSRNYYYIPEGEFDSKILSVRYVALYQSVNMFAADAGIRYWGEITQTKRIQRKNISFPMRRHNGEEWYYAFRVRKWEQLAKPVFVRNEGVYSPRLTNMFLLQHCSESYELFDVQSPEQYCLLYALKRSLAETWDNASVLQEVYRSESGISLWIRNGQLDLLDENGISILDSPFDVEYVTTHIQWFFRMLVRKFDV